MNRRNFFKNLSGIVAGAIISPQILNSMSSTTEDTLFSDTYEINYEDMFDDNKLTEDFFKFLNSSEMQFKWERINSSSIMLNSGRRYICETHYVSNEHKNRKKAFFDFCKRFNKNETIYFYSAEHSGNGNFLIRLIKT